MDETAREQNNTSQACSTRDLICDRPPAPSGANKLVDSGVTPSCTYQNIPCREKPALRMRQNSRGEVLR
jgi:hypothetical protein